MMPFFSSSSFLARWDAEVMADAREAILYHAVEATWGRWLSNKILCKGTWSLTLRAPWLALHGLLLGLFHVREKYVYVSIIFRSSHHCLVFCFT